MASSENACEKEQQAIATTSEQTLTNGSLQNRLQLFVITFVQEFESTLFWYYEFLNEELEEIKRLLKSNQEIADCTALFKGLGFGGMMFNFFSEKLQIQTDSDGRVVTSETNDQKHEKNANMLWDFIRFYKEDKPCLRKMLVTTALDIFRSFECQFVKVNDNEKWSEAMISLAKDAVYRSISYCVNQYKLATGPNENIISKGVICGKSNDTPLNQEPELIYEDDLGQIKWTTSNIYEKPGIFIEGNFSPLYFEKKREGNVETTRVSTYGFRKLLQYEDWNELQKDYESFSKEDNRFRNYKYTFEMLSEDERTQFSNKVYSQNDNANIEKGREIFEDFKNSITDEILKQLRKTDENLEKYEILNKLPFENDDLDKYFPTLKDETEESTEHYTDTSDDGSVTTKKSTGSRTVSERITLDENTIFYNTENPIDMFTGRKEELDELDKIIQRDTDGSATITVICGYGGIGKSQLAKRYIQKRAQHQYQYIIWVNGESDTYIFHSLSLFARTELNLNIPYNNQDKIMNGSLSTIFEILSKTNTLIIFDNADSSLENFISTFLPLDSNKLHILITSRCQNWGTSVEGIVLNELSPEDGKQLVKKGLKIEDDSQDEVITEFLDKLRHFPLSIVQAISYIKAEEEGYTLKNYLEKIDKHDKELPNSDCIDNPYTKIAYTILRITIKKLKNKINGELALQKMYIMAYLSPRNIKRNFFVKISQNEERFKEAIQLLTKYSIVNENVDLTTLSTHRLVQIATRLYLKETKKEIEVIEKTQDVLLEEYHFGKIDSQQSKRYIGNTVLHRDYVMIYEGLPHFETLLSLIRSKINEDDYKNTGKTDVEQYFEKIAVYTIQFHGYLDNLKDFRNLLDELIIVREKLYGSESYYPNTALTMRNLAVVNELLGDVEKKTEWLDKALTMEEKRDGLDDNALSLLNNLSSNYEKSGHYLKQKQFLKRVLKIKEKYYSYDHYQMAETMKDLGFAYGLLGKIQKQKYYLEKALVIYKNRYGNNNQETISVMASLSSAYSKLGEDQKCSKMHDEVTDYHKRKWRLFGTPGTQDILIMPKPKNGINFENTEKKQEKASDNVDSSVRSKPFKRVVKNLNRFTFRVLELCD